MATKDRPVNAEQTRIQRRTLIELRGTEMASFMRHRILFALLASAVINLLASSVQAASLGIVLIHGKQGRSEQFVPIAEAFNQAGWLTERPEMCWSRARIYDRSYLDCLGDIDAAVARLRRRGATDIVVIGMSLGGNAVLAYGARRDGIKGIIALAPAHAPEFISRRPEIADSLDKARGLIAAGRGDAAESFADVNTGEGTSFYNFTVNTTAKIYESFFAPDSPAVMPANAAKLKAPLLIVSGTSDPTQRGARAIFERVPAHAMNRFVEVNATHTGTPAAGRATMFSWLHDIAGR
jgi:pimeloyl-ACP methyl ester carboxylesterase